MKNPMFTLVLAGSLASALAAATVPAFAADIPAR